MKIFTPKANADINKNMKAAYYDYDNYQIQTGEISDYAICNKLGRGKYSEVFEGKYQPGKSHSSHKHSKEGRRHHSREGSKESLKKEDSKELQSKEQHSNDKQHSKEQNSNDKQHSKEQHSKEQHSKEQHSKEPQERVVIKVLKPVRNVKINREVLILRNLSHPHIISLKDVVYDTQSATYSLIFSYIQHKDFTELVEHSSLGSIKHYTRQILEALAYCHSMGIMHRDIKPHNMIVDSATKELKIIDWGLAEFYHENQEYSVHVASRYYKGPELLVDYPFYDYSLDIWSFGCVFAELLFKKTPFFHGLKNSSQLSEIAKVLGTNDLNAYLEKYEIVYDAPKECPEERISLASFLPEALMPIARDAVDLLESILVYDPSLRPTAAECLEHPFFAK
ncbi:casein kinase II subunit alpha [Enteropsectra breve]|nr:casein kinase II subunit alpha [Enteropsectra breve]